MPVAEELLHESTLGDRGVLVLIEQHDVIGRANRCGHLGEPRDEEERESRLIGEVEHIACLFLGTPLDDELGEGNASLTRGPDLQCLDLGDARCIDLGDGDALMLDELGRIDGEIAELIVESKHRADHGDRRAPDLTQVDGRSTDEAIGEGMPRTVGEQSCIRLSTEAQPMLGHDARREGVVRGDHRIGMCISSGVGAFVIGLDEPLCACLAELLANATEELGGSLVREGQAEDAIGGDEASADEIRDPGSHRCRLAGASTGDDHPGLERRTDDIPLLVAHREAEDLGECLAVHVTTPCPSGWAGHAVR